MSTSVRAMIDLAVALEDRFGMETLALGRSATDDADSVLEIGGTWFLFRVALHGPEVRTAATLMDAADPPQTLLRAPDTEAGWDTAQRLVASLERNGVRSLQRPIKAANPASTGMRG
jgi:hypothetical protein